LPSLIKALIRHEYSLRSDILTHLCNHIDNLNRNSIIYHTNRNRLMNKLTNTVLLLNTNYNDALPQYKTLNYVPSTAELQLINNSNVEGYLKFVSTQTNALRRKICDFFSSVDENIYSL